MREPIADRECGTCNVCCIELTIDDVELRKVAGYRCRNLVAHGGCGIYPDRPKTCRSFDCGWRMLKWIKPGLRPDRSGVLFRFQTTKDGTIGVIVSLLDGTALKAEGLAESVAAAVAAGLAVYLHIPGPPGYTSAQARIDGALTHAVGALDKAAVLKILRDGRRQARAGRYEPIRLGPPKAAPQSGSESE